MITLVAPLLSSVMEMTLILGYLSQDKAYTWVLPRYSIEHPELCPALRVQKFTFPQLTAEYIYFLWHLFTELATILE